MKCYKGIFFFFFFTENYETRALKRSENAHLNLDELFHVFTINRQQPFYILIANRGSRRGGFTTM